LELLGVAELNMPRLSLLPADDSSKDTAAGVALFNPQGSSGLSFHQMLALAGKTALKEEPAGR
jgi:hypothetical protein